MRCGGGGGGEARDVCREWERGRGGKIYIDSHRDPDYRAFRAEAWVVCFLSH